MSKLHDLKTIPDCFGTRYNPYDWACIKCKRKASCGEKYNPVEPKLEDFLEKFKVAKPR